jgi:hypothetical protein
MNNQGDDYSPKQIIQDLAASIQQPDKFAQIFCNAAETQTPIAKILKGKIKELIESDKETIDLIKKYQREIDKEDWRFFMKKIGVAGWSIIMMFIGALFTLLVKNIFHG